MCACCWTGGRRAPGPHDATTVYILWRVLSSTRGGGSYTRGVGGASVLGLVKRLSTVLIVIDVAHASGVPHATALALGLSGRLASLLPSIPFMEPQRRDGTAAICVRFLQEPEFQDECRTPCGNAFDLVLRRI